MIDRRANRMKIHGCVGWEDDCSQQEKSMITPP
jgi:hypothetical protein